MGNENKTNIIQNKIRDNTIITEGNNYAYSINIINKTVPIYSNYINTTARTSVAVQLTTTKSNEVNANRIVSNKNDGYGVILSSCEGTKVSSNGFYLNGNNITVLSLYNAINTTIDSNIININGTKPIAIESISSNTINITKNNIQTTLYDINNTNSSIELINSNKVLIKENNIVSGNINTITFDKDTKNTLTENNTLLTSNKLGDETVNKIGTINNVVRGNTPVNPPETYMFLNEKTYDDYFDKNGVLKDEVPENLTILLTGNLNNKILNITKSVNIITQKASYNDVTMIITAKVNITGAVFQGENTKIIIQSNNSNILIERLDIENTHSLNLNPIEILGNKNNIIIDRIDADTNMRLNSNITAIKITGKQNKISIDLSSLLNFNKITAIKLENASNNEIESRYIRCENSTQADLVVLINSNNNRIISNQLNNEETNFNFTAIKLENSSNNYLTGKVYGKYSTYEKAVILENNSNNNKIIGMTINRVESPILIRNSHYNNIYANNINSKDSKTFLINIEEGVGNKVKYNALASSNLCGNRAVLQENMNDTLNNLVANNSEFVYPIITKIRITILELESIKINQTFTITANVSTGMGSRAKPMSGLLTFILNGDEIGEVELVNGMASLNYTLNDSEFDKAFIELSYNGKLANESQVKNQTVNIEKLNTKLIMTNVTNTGMTSTFTSMVMNENGDILYDGDVVFKVDDETVGKVSIKNGIAQLTIDTTQYALGEHKLYAQYSGVGFNAQTNATAVLTIVKYNVNVKPETKIENNKLTITAKVSDINSNLINNGYMVFKLNGRTLKDKNGNTLTTNITNGFATLTYDLPENMSPKNYTLTTVALADTYNRSEVNTTITVPKTTPKISIDNTKVKRTNNTKITVKLTNTSQNPISVDTNIAVKLNGNTILKTKTVNATAQINLDLTQYKNSKYDLTIVSGENKLYNKSNLTTELKIE